MSAKAQKTAVTLVVIAMILLLLMLIGFDIYPTFSGNDYYVIEQQAWVQVARSEYIAKDVLVLAYRPSSYHSQAVNELQTVLPQLEQTQTGFQKGDLSLGLPVPSDEISQSLNRIQSDYLAVITAVQKLINESDGPTDPIQVNIVAMHENQYALGMAQVALLIQQQAETIKEHLLIIKVVLKTMLILVIGGHFILSGRHILNKLIEIEANQTKGEKSP